MKGKANLFGSRSDDKGDTTQKLNHVERLSSKVKEKSFCDTHSRSCAILNTGTHIHLIHEDFSKWATMIVSQLPCKQCGAFTEKIKIALWWCDRGKVSRLDCPGSTEMGG